MESVKEFSKQDELNPSDDKVGPKTTESKATSEEMDVKTVVSENNTETTLDENDKQEETEINGAELTDQNISSSWVFVDVKRTDGAKQDSTNKFYLDCSEEPVQELHEHELSVHNSGSEDDTDGISVISDPDVFKTDEEDVSHLDITEDQLKNKKNEADAAINEEANSSKEILKASNNVPVVHKQVFTVNQISYIAAFSVIILLIPLQWYFKDTDFEKKEIETPQDVLNILSQRKIQSQQQESLSSQNVIDDALTYCTKIHENTDYMYKNRNIKKCMKKLERAKDKLNRVHKNLQNTIPEPDDNTGQDVEEIHLNYKAIYSKVNNNENKHEVYSKKVRYRKPHENKQKNKYDKEYKITRNTTNNDSEAYKFEYLSDNEFRKNHTLNNSKSQPKDKYKHGNYKHSRKDEGYEHRLIAQEMYLREKEKYLQRKEQELKQRELKRHTKENSAPNIDEKILKTRNESSKDFKRKTYKKHHKDDHIPKFENSNDEYSKNKYTQFENTNERHSRKKHSHYETKSSSSDESSNERKDYQDKRHKNENDKYTRHMKGKNDRSGGLHDDHVKNGDWYNELFEGRSKFRKNNIYDTSHEDDKSERSKHRRNSYKSKYETDDENRDKSGQWYSKLFAGRAKLRKSTDKYFMKDDNFLNEYKLYSNRYRSDSISL